MRRLKGAIAAVVVVAFFVQEMLSPAAAAPRPPAEPRPSADAAEVDGAERVAVEAARRLGRPVEVSGRKSETAHTFATPEGTLVFEEFSVPRWTMGTAGWRDIDTTLVRDSGAVTPRATLAPVTFSPGGTDSLVRLSAGGGALTLSWPTSLPEPHVAGDSAVYESVLPGVDLRVRALVDGFTWVLVVHTAQAAANPALDTLHFGLSAEGLTVRDGVDGGYELVDPDGVVVASASEALMWDSTGLLPQARTARGSAALADDAVVRAVPDTAKSARVETSVDGAELQIVPDVALLRGEGTVYPVVIDPATTINKARWGYANSTNVNRNDGQARVGYNPDGSGIYRSFFGFNVGGLHGKIIRNVKFHTLLKHSYSCDPTPVSLYRVETFATSGRFAWDGPNLGNHVLEKYGNAHKETGDGGGCSNDQQPDMPMEFSNTGLRVNLTDFLEAGWSNYTLGLSNRRESGNGEDLESYWKRFDPAKTKLAVEYNTPPNTATAAQLTTHADFHGPANACVTGAGRPVVRSSTPWLKAVLTDADGANGGTLSGTFALEQWSGSAWAAVPGWPQTISGVSPGAQAAANIAQPVPGTGRFRWQVQTKDTLGGTSAGWSPWCEFDTDQTPPATRPAVTSADGVYPEFPNQVAGGGAGQSGRFTFSANGEADVVAFVYKLADGPERVVAATTMGGTATAWVTPNTVGRNILTVWSRDGASNTSEAYDYVFLAGDLSAPTAVWRMDEGVGTSLVTSPSGGPSGTLVNGPTWTDSRILGTSAATGRDAAVRFDGANDHATLPGPVIDTTRTFSVAAWVRVNATGGTATRAAVSQDGVSTSGFVLGQTPTGNKWFMSMSETDTPSAARPAASSTSAPVAGVWTLIAGTFDLAGKQQRLYVNGQLESTASLQAGIDAQGPMVIGRARWNNMALDWFGGDVAEVRVWDRALDPSKDLKPLTANVEVGRWHMDSWATETRLEDDLSEYGRPLTLTTAPSADWCEGSIDFTSSICLDGVSGSADTAGPVLRTDQSFTVTAWARLDSKGNYQTVLAQDGTAVSAFYLQASPHDRWRLVAGSADGGGTQWIVSSLAPPVVNEWTHLAAVYDAQQKTLRLFVNGALQGQATGATMWHAPNKFHVGRAFSANFTPGAVDRVTAWAGALTEAEISDILQES